MEISHSFVRPLNKDYLGTYGASSPVNGTGDGTDQKLCFHRADLAKGQGNHTTNITHIIR